MPVEQGATMRKLTRGSQRPHSERALRAGQGGCWLYTEATGACRGDQDACPVINWNPEGPEAVVRLLLVAESIEINVNPEGRAQDRQVLCQPAVDG